MRAAGLDGALVEGGATESILVGVGVAAGIGVGVGVGVGVVGNAPPEVFPFRTAELPLEDGTPEDGLPYTLPPLNE